MQKIWQLKLQKVTIQQIKGQHENEKRTKVKPTQLFLSLFLLFPVAFSI